MLRPVDVALATDGWCKWVFHLEPLVGAASTIGRAKALRHDALASQGAGMFVDGGALAVVGRVAATPWCRCRSAQARCCFLSSIGPTAGRAVSRLCRRRIRSRRDRAGDDEQVEDSRGRYGPRR